MKQRESSCQNALGSSTQVLAEEVIRYSAESSFDIPADLCLLPEFDHQGLGRNLKNSGCDISKMDSLSVDLNESGFLAHYDSTEDRDPSKQTIDGLIQSDSSKK